MLDFAQFSPLLLSLLFTSLILFFIHKIISLQTSKDSNKLPKSYPLIGHLIPFYQHKKGRFQWMSSLITTSPSSTIILHRPFGGQNILTGNPAVVEHILKTQFRVYQKGPYQKEILGDLIGDGIFNADSESWKFQRQVASHEFNTKSLRKFIVTVVDTELSDRLIPILAEAAKNNEVLDLQDVLQRFTFDNICKISFGYDPQYLSPSLPQTKLAAAFEEATILSAKRFRTFFPLFWKIQKLLNIGSERKLREAVLEIREFANSIVRRKKQDNNTTMKTEDLLSRFLNSGYSDEKFVTDIVISFILAGRDTTSSALTWFFWLLHKNKSVEEEILTEIRKKETNQQSILTEVKELTYTHAALTESMRLYPPIPADTKEAIANDILPDGTAVKSGTRVTYHPYAMGRDEKLWGADWAVYRPERWLEVEKNKNGVEGKGKWKFMPRDPYSYPVFQAGPRICLGKEMAYLQMKRVAAGILATFRVVPIAEEGFEPIVPNLTAKMRGGLMVRIEERNETGHSKGSLD